VEGVIRLPINFHDEAIRNSYATREADISWMNAMQSTVSPQGLRVADIGCGGGIYTRGWLKLGVKHVVGVDASRVMLDAAMEALGDNPQVSFQFGDAGATGLPDGSVDLAFQRALIHHLEDLGAVMAEANRILSPGGWLVVQDRTPDDVSLPGSPDHLRGYFFERFPRLLELEQSRRWTTGQVVSAMERAGFREVRSFTFWETRRVYESCAELAADMRARTGRSILHELDDSELEDLIAFIDQKVEKDAPIVEKDRWTVWYGRKLP
jgi:ubiquinone/menaquinone biosynthesis C-methylase UbiE